MLRSICIKDYDYQVSNCLEIYKDLSTPFHDVDNKLS